MLSRGPISGAPISGAGSAGVNIDVPVAEIVTAALAPAVASGASVAVPAALVVTQGIAPAVAGGASVTVPAAGTNVQAYAPAVELTLEIDVPAATITVTGYAPAIFAGASVAVPAAVVIVQAFAPAVAAGVSLAAPAAGVSVTAFPPFVEIVIPARADPIRVYLVDISAVDADGAAQTLRFSSGYGYTSRGDDSPAWGSWLPGLKVTGNVQCNLFAPGATQGAAQSGAGEIRIANVDGAWDHLLGWAFDGRTITIRRLPNERAALTEAVTVFTGSAQDATFDADGIAWTIRDRLDVLKLPIQTARYAGTTTSGGAGGIEGNADVEGLIKPLAFGVLLNIAPVVANAFDLIYQISTNVLSSVDAVYDRGQELTFDGNDYEDADALELADVEPGTYATCLAEGLIKLGSIPDGLITCDVTEGGGSPTTDTAAQIVERILLTYGGLTSGDLIEASFTALDTLNSAPVGIYITDERDVLEVCSEILQGIDATLTTDRLGRFGVYRVDLPADDATPDVVFTADDVLGDDVQYIPANDGNAGIPPWQIVLEYRRNWSVQGKDELAGSVLECADAERRQFLAEEWRKVTAEDSAVLTRHKLSRPVTRQSLIVGKTDAETEVARRFALRSVKRQPLTFTVPADRADTLDRLAVVRFEYPRYGNDTGLLYSLIGTIYDFDRDRITVTLWGGVDPA